MYLLFVTLADLGRGTLSLNLPKVQMCILFLIFLDQPLLAVQTGIFEDRILLVVRYDLSNQLIIKTMYCCNGFVGKYCEKGKFHINIEWLAWLASSDLI